MAECNILYNPDEHRKKLTGLLNRALLRGKINAFTEDFVLARYKAPQQMRLTPNDSDSETEVVQSMRALLKDIDDVLMSWDAKHPNSKMRDVAMKAITDALNVVDETQTASEEEDTESKTKGEVADKNAANLNDHMTEFYGLEAFDIVSSLKQTFEDTIASVAYYDINSGDIKEQTNVDLNNNIRKQKAQLFKTIVKYLKEKYPDNQAVAKLSGDMYDGNLLNTQNYYSALSKFYSLVASDPGFKDSLQAAHAERVRETAKTDKTKQYSDLVKILEADETFKKKMDRKFPGGKRQKLATQLYTADHLSEYFAAVKKFVVENKPELMSVIEGIEQSNTDILEVANAYTMLRHFDSLLQDVYGDQISITSGTAGFETDILDKYSYHQDTAHERKGWQTSEDIGSEKHTSRFTNAVIRMIRIFDHKTGEFMHRRVDNTTLIVAARNLMNAVLTGKVQFTAESKAAERTIAELRDRIIMFHNNPVVQLQRILELLYERQPNIAHPLVHYMTNRQTVNDYDLSVLKSVYEAVFNRNNSQSFYSQSISNTLNDKQATQSLLEEVASFVDRNVTAAYLETIYDFETGAPTVRAKKKFFNTKQLYMLQAGINAHVNGMPIADRQRIGSTYNLRITEDDSTNTRYTVTIGGKEFTLKIPNGLVTQILAKNLNRGPQMAFEAETGLFKKLEDINLVEFRYKIERGINLTEDEQVLKSVLQFLDDTLNLGVLTDPNRGLQTLQSYKQIYNKVDGFKSFLMPLLKLGMRAAYANQMYINAGDQSLGSYLSDSKNAIYAFHLRDKKSKIFTTRFNNVKYQIASYADDALGIWTDAKSILNGEASKATTKDKQGNSIPNNSVSKLGGILHYYLGKQFDTNMGSLLFVNNPDLIMETFHDLEVTNMQNDSKSVRDFSNGELFYHAIFNKFWGSYLSNGSVIVQPTTYADKTTFLNWEIMSNIDGIDIARTSPDQIIRLYMDTIGQAYTKSFNHTVAKLKKITEAYKTEYNAKRLAGDDAYRASHPEITATDYRDIMHLMSENDLRITANKIGETVELNKDYKIIKNKDGKSVVGVNGTLEYNANLYNDAEALGRKLLQERNEFLNQLLFNGCSYQVLEGNDYLGMYTDDKIDEGAKSRNPILSTILSFFENDVEGRKAFFNDWVDGDTGKLILAKQNGHNIISVSDGFNINQDIVLNPLLDKFFYAEGLLSNNLRYSLTGFEVNHPSGKKSPFGVTKTKTLEDWNKLGTYGVLTQTEWKRLHNSQNTGVFDRILDVDDLNRVMASGELNDSPVLMEAMSKLLEDVYNYDTNTSQGAQFKRNVIIPATLQYVTQNAKEGVPPRVKCAVIRDTEAHVFNYRGDHEDTIDANDGSAKITPFQSILENRALGSQAVGFIKKPIWHAYDTASGTAFLAKFATDTITNESMRMSLNSKGPDFKLFKKATNLQWNPNDNIDLTKSLVKSRSMAGNEDMDARQQHQDWFKKVILQNGRLFYEDKYGTVMEIVGFNKTVTQGGTVLYYTEERKDNVLGENPIVRKYHVFHNETAQDGTRVTSVHTTVDTWQKANDLIQSYNAAGQDGHTINSLFELHSALGGVYCVDSNGVGSEFNNEVVVNFMCNVGQRMDNVGSKEFVSQETYIQPLKNYQIGYLLNNSAVKNGAKNINPKEAWLDDSELTYFEVDSDGLGMQMNADHDIVNAELTEFSQVIAATAAYGYTFDNCYEIFKGLAYTALQASEKTIKATDNYIRLLAEDKQTQATSELYDAIGRIILMNQSIKSNENLTNIIMQAVNKVFNKYKDHTKDESKIPFSDPNIYSDFIATLASTITKASIKRTHPGSGCVMVPAYNMIQYFELPIENPAPGHPRVEKLMASDILRRARAEYRTELTAFLKSQEGAEQADAVYRRATLQELEQQALAIDSTGAFSQYYTTLQDNADASKYMIQTFLSKRQEAMPVYDDQSFFMPSDNVEILNPNGTHFDTVSLDKDLGEYYQFKKGIMPDGREIPKGAKFRLSTTTPYNLRPSLVRWQYKDAKGNIKFKNIFDLSVIKDSWDAEGAKTAEQRRHVQNVLHDIVEKGQFIDDDGVTRDIIPGTLENEAAELVMSNLYKETFGIENESLSEVLSQGEEYFVRQAKNMKTPVSTVYDLAFLRDNGKHTLITIGEVALNEMIQPEEFKNTMTNEKDEIVIVRGGREVFEVGRWQYTSEVSFNPESKKFESSTVDVTDQTKFRVKDGKVQQRFDYVTQYTVSTKKTTRKGTTYQTNTLYKVANVEVFKKALGPNATDNDAYKQQSSIIQKIYSAGDYKLAQLNPAKAMSQNKRNALKNALQFMLTNHYIKPNVKALLERQISMVGTDTKQNYQEFEQAKLEFFKEEAHRKYVSFLDSLNFIASRIPAQTLQSFMAMKLVAWTENSKNMAYVSHFQTYLQGSDYDIDKAYIMGQSYDSNSIYINWSPFFDYTSLNTLTASKSIPVPKGITITIEEGGLDLTSEIDTLVQSSKIDNIDENTNVARKGAVLTTDGMTEEQKLKFIRTLTDVIRKAERADGKISYNGMLDRDMQRVVLNTLIRHEKYHIPESIAEAAYKNVASANIYAVSHDIRNRDQAYTAISMGMMRKAADNSPKGEQAAKLNMLNPLTKYIMQYQNLVGKNVIGITANGEKFWFNAYYYWTHVLTLGNDEDMKYLQFNQTLNRIQDRHLSTNLEIICRQHNVTHLPDLNVREKVIADKLREAFGATEESLEYRYVDQVISQLLSAATDNAKELILAKINAGTNYAKMYLYLITMGYNLDDIAAFMYSPISEFIDSRSATNMFQSNAGMGGPNSAINAALCKVSGKSFLHGTITERDPESDEEVSVSKIDVMANIIDSLTYDYPKVRELMMKSLGLEEGSDLRKSGLDKMMQALIEVAVTHPRSIDSTEDFSLTKIFGQQSDAEVNNYLRHCQDLVQQLRTVKRQYNNKYDELQADAKEFKKIYELASEISSVASGYLGLNQGLPTDKLSILKRLNSMRKVISDRETALEIRAGELYKEVKDERDKARQMADWEAVISRVMDNNPDLDEDTIREAFDNAHEAGIMNHFDVVRMLTDENYKQIAKDYLHVIKGTVNVIDMMDKIPHYKEIMSCLRSLVVADKALSLKSRLIDQLIQEGRSVTDQQLSGILRYVDQLNIMDFLDTEAVPIFDTKQSVVGFDTTFDTVSVDKFDLQSPEGVAGFKHFVETEFLSYLRTQHRDNPLVKHLNKIVSEGMVVLSTDIDLLNPNVTTASRLAYDEILRGTSMFEGVKYNDDYTITDILQLYNLIVNSNQYGGERLTTMFKVCTRQDGILNKFLNFTASRDYDSLFVPEYHQTDYEINSAPVVSPSAERFQNAPFIKVKDPIWDYVLKQYNAKTNEYSTYPLLPAFTDETASEEQKNQRRVNFAENYPFEMPNRSKIRATVRALNFTGEFTPEVEKTLRTALVDLSKSGRIIITKIC